MKKILLRHGISFLIALILTTPTGWIKVHAKTQSTLDIELNGLAKINNGCRMDFVMHNGLAKSIEALSLEIVLFKNDGRIKNILALKVGSLPVGNTRVKRFRLKACEDISRILINDVKACKGEGLAPRICMKSLKTNNRTDIKFGL
jgi:hypothetical protein